MQKLLQTSNEFTLTSARLILGIVFFAHGAQKVLGWFGGFTATVGAFGKMGMSPGLVYFVMFVEFFCGLSMTFGL